MTEPWWRMVLAAGALLASLLAAAPALAHLTPNSEIRLHFEPGALRAQVLIPAGEFAYATGLAADNRAASLDHAGRYLLEHAAVRTPPGRAWAEAVDRIAVVAAPGGPDLIASLRFEAPAGAPDRSLTLEWDAVIERSPDHFALLAVEGDIAAGQAEANDLLGAFVASRRTIAIDRSAAAPGGLFVGAMRLGARHILAGHDHLLFLLALLLPAPLLAAGTRWGGPRKPHDCVRALVLVVSAFTVGHSVTLIAAALFDATLPAPPVEAAIALSVLISAIHAMGPLFPGREPAVAAGFGLVHGLAFATVVTGFGAGAATRATAILGFNLGIELVQLSLAAALLPGLLIGARSRYYPVVRRVLAALTMMAALAWLVERVSGRSNIVAATFEPLLPWLGLALLALSLGIGLMWSIRRQRPPTAFAAALKRA
ncbi:MAG: HupE/UreJ family protein [Novosphingobium sp.]